MSTDRTRRAGDDAPARRPLAGVRPVLWAGVGVVVVALLAGVVFSRTDPRRAATLLLGDQVRTEPEGEVTSGPAPTSGQRADGPRCGVVTEAVGPQAQVDALAAGIVMVQYRDADDAAAVAEALAARPTEVLVAPNAALDAPVVATAWGRRLRLQAVDPAMLRAFVTAHAGVGPAVTPCVPAASGAGPSGH